MKFNLGIKLDTNTKVILTTIIMVIVFTILALAVTSWTVSGFMVNGIENPAMVNGIENPAMVNGVEKPAGGTVNVYIATDGPNRCSLCEFGDLTGTYQLVGSIPAGGSYAYAAISDSNFYTDDVSVTAGDGTVSGGTREGGHCYGDIEYITVTSTGTTDIYVWVDLYYDS